MFFVMRHSTNHGESFSSDEPFGEWWNDNDWNYPETIQLVPDGNTHYGSIGLFPGETEPKEGDFVYLVFVQYSAGDSFGTETGIRADLWCFTDQNKAYTLKEMIQVNRKGITLDFQGVKISTHSWHGHFETFEFVEVHRMMFDPEDKMNKDD